jgi:para-aminobenzoate synthetase / 4-amino-4-deoxychorismate lyase
MSDLHRPDRSAGVFETLLVLDGSPIEADAHLQRLRASVRQLFGAELPPRAGALLDETAAGLAVGRLRLAVAPAGDGALRARAVAAATDPEDLLPSWERAIALCPFLVAGGLGAHKWADREGLARIERDLPGDAIALLTDAGGEVLEASRANVFAVEDDRLLTPPCDGRILPGVARARVIEEARTAGVQVREERLDADRLLAAGEAFLTGSLRGIEPVRSLGDTVLRAPGQAQSALVGRLRRRWTARGAGGPLRR